MQRGIIKFQISGHFETYSYHSHHQERQFDQLCQNWITVRFDFCHLTKKEK